jgi:hypothetical protein
MKFELQDKDLQALGNYLASRPWSEVNGLITILQKLTVIPEAPVSAQEAPAPVLSAVPSPSDASQG